MTPEFSESTLLPVTVPPEGEPIARPPKMPPRILLPTMLRLGLFQMGLGMMSVLTLGLLNRVMGSELAIPLDIAAGAIAMHQIIAPARVWFGQMSDAKPLFGLHRSGYVWTGAIVFAILSFLIVQAMWQLGAAVDAAGRWSWEGPVGGWTVVLGLLFAGYGLSISASSTPFAALLVDVSDEDNRSKLVGVVWSMLMVGIIIGAIATSVLLKRAEAVNSLAALQMAVNQLFIVVPVVVVGLAFAATWGVEKRFSRYGVRSHLVEREDQITLGRALRVLTASRQTAIFFGFLLAMTLGLFLQEAVLENYGGQVFKMPPSATTSLNAFFGTGTLIGLIVTGFGIIPRLGKQRTAKLGAVLTIAALGLIILAGFSQNPDPAVLGANPAALKAAVGMFGLASGIVTTGALTLMLDLTAAETAGTFIGAWGLAQALAKAVSTWLGGLIYQRVGLALFGQPLYGFATVFGVQALMMVVAIGLLWWVNVREFKTDSQQAIANVLQVEMD
ncbi:MAG TPA: BCD family MFS transporter [Coleofasciculaceae cyanobacterium]